MSTVTERGPRGVTRKRDAHCALGVGLGVSVGGETVQLEEC